MKTVLIGDWKKDMCVVPSVQQIQINYNVNNFIQMTEPLLSLSKSIQFSYKDKDKS